LHERNVIGATVGFAQVSSIALVVAIQAGFHVLGMQFIQRCAGDDSLAQWKEGFHGNSIEKVELGNGLRRKKLGNVPCFGGCLGVMNGNPLISLPRPGQLRNDGHASA
jgi:hypothetical protein